MLWRSSRYDTALTCGNETRVLSEKLSFKKGLAVALKNIGRVYDYLGNYPKAFEYQFNSLKINKELNNKFGIAVNMVNIGLVYSDQGDYPKSLEFDLKALEIIEEIRNKGYEETILGNIGLVYDQQGNFTQALEYDQKALKIAKEIGDKHGIARHYSNIGTVLKGQNNYQEALSYFFMALKIGKELEYKQLLANTLGNIGDIYCFERKYPEALEYYFKTLALNRESGDRRLATYSYIGIGNTYVLQKNKISARTYLDSALVFSKAVGDKDAIKETYMAFTNLDSATGSFTTELIDYKKFIVYRDSLVNEANTKKTVQAEMNYQFEQQQAAEKAKQDKKDATAELERKKQVVIRNFLLAGFALVLALTFLILRGYRQKQRANIIITRQKEEVDKSQKKVMDSMRYAQKIQYSLLPSSEEINKYMGRYFVYLLPKDIVSGDFYWFHHADRLSYIAVVDCTGHGVPGACMSMLAHSFLNEIVIEKGISEPTEILSLMHQLVFTTLHQEKGDEYSQDGMDISLVVIDHKQNTATFAGAKNNAFVIDEENVQTLKASPKSIGGLSLLGEIEPVRQFKSEVYEIKKGALFILSTDGIVDQLNSQDEKFGKNRFNVLIQSILRNGIENADTLVQTAINDWKGGAPQTDDILLMGIRM